MRASPLIAVLPMLAATWVGAAETSPPADEQILEVHINGQQAGSTLLVRRDADGALLVRAEDFDSLRLKPPQVATIVIDGVAYFRLDAAIGADVRFDEATQSATLTLPASAFQSTVTSRTD